MTESILVDAATVLAGAETACTPFRVPVPGAVQFRVASDEAYRAKFYASDATFTDPADAAELDDTADSHAATTGIIYSVDAGAYPYVACVVTNDDPVDAATVTVAVGYELVAEAAAALFTVAEARAADKAQLADSDDYPDAVIIAAEAAIRERFTETYCGVDFISTQHVETLDGDGTDTLIVEWPEVQSVTSITVDGVALTAAEIDPDDYDAGLAIYETGLLVRRSGVFNAGKQNVTVTYVAGYETVPALIKQAALTLAVNELPASNVPFQATSFDAGGGSYTFDRGDGYNGVWESYPVVMKAIRAYDHIPLGLA